MKHRAVVGISYTDKDGKPKRVEAGKTATDLPQDAVPWLLEQGLIEETK